jgi:hypothetical protein
MLHVSLYQAASFYSGRSDRATLDLASTQIPDNPQRPGRSMAPISHFPKANEVSMLSVFLFETMIKGFKRLPNYSVFCRVTHLLRSSAVRPKDCQQL